MHYDLSDIVIDLVMNSLEAHAGNVNLKIEETAFGIAIQVDDDGSGMTSEEVRQVRNPFFTDGKKHPGRRVGLGLAFVSQIVELTGGSLRIESEKGRGTRVCLKLPAGHIDCPPLGNIADCFVTVFCAAGAYECRIVRRRPGKEYCVKRSELLRALGDIDSPVSLNLLREYLESLEEDYGQNDA